MSEATKRKHVAKEVLEEFPEPGPAQAIVRVLGARGNNLHEAQWPTGSRGLCSMPTKFRKRVWIKRGDYVIVTPIEEGDKIRHLKRNKMWPEGFAVESGNAVEHIDAELAAIKIDDLDVCVADGDGDSEEDSSEPDDMPDIVANTNRRVIPDEQTDESDESDESDG